MRIGVIGGGSFGTALAKLLAELEHDVVLWFRDPERAREVAAVRENRDYLPGVQLAANIRVSSDLEEAVAGRELLVAMGPSHVMRDVMARARPFVQGNPYLVSAAKGIEEHTHKRMTEVLEDIFGPASADRIAVLSGPSFAREIAQGMPTAVTAAATSLATAERVQNVFRGPTFRVYSSTDPTGVELGGAAKNVVAIAAGVSDGLGFGSSSRAALITRGVAEIARLVEAFGGDARTVSGLSGVGDIVLTCTGDLSRNRTVGLRMGRGERLSDVLASMQSVAEGVRNSVSVEALAHKAGIEMPITEQVRLMLHEDKPALQVIGEFMQRASKPEF